MQYELFNWENSVAIVPEPDLTDAWKQDFQKESVRIKAAFMEVVLSNEPADAIERYVQTHQTGLLQLSLFLQRASDAGSDPELYTYLFSCLDDVYCFLERFCEKYMSADTALPAFRSKKFARIIEGKIPVIKRQLSLAKVDDVLIGVILELLQEAIERSNTLTYRQWYPLREMMACIEGLPRWKEDETPMVAGIDTTSRVLEWLYFLNINTLPVYRYVKFRMTALIEEKAYSFEQIREVNRVQRYFSWLEQRPGYRYMETRGSIKQMLSGWLEHMLQSKEQERLASGDEDARDDSGFGLDSKKVITSLTVNELGLLVRLFMETGVFRTRNKKGLARFMAQNVVTLQKEAYEEASSNSLYGTLYSTTDATMDSVQAILNRMITRLGKFRLEQKGKKIKPSDSTRKGRKKPSKEAEGK